MLKEVLKATVKCLPDGKADPRERLKGTENGNYDIVLRGLYYA